MVRRSFPIDLSLPYAPRMAGRVLGKWIFQIFQLGFEPSYRTSRIWFTKMGQIRRRAFLIARILGIDKPPMEISPDQLSRKNICKRAPLSEMNRNKNIRRNDSLRRRLRMSAIERRDRSRIMEYEIDCPAIETLACKALCG